MEFDKHLDSKNQFVIPKTFSLEDFVNDVNEIYEHPLAAGMYKLGLKKKKFTLNMDKDDFCNSILNSSGHECGVRVSNILTLHSLAMFRHRIADLLSSIENAVLIIILTIESQSLINSYSIKSDIVETGANLRGFSSTYEKKWERVCWNGRRFFRHQ
jgi:hypothetical protein